jgi:hypothetical protein
MMEAHTPAPYEEIAVLLWITFAVAVALFQLWYAAAFIFAYAQTRQPALFLMVAQALLMLAAFVYLGLALAYSWAANTVLVAVLLVGAMAMSLIWRRHPAGLPSVLKQYPRGTMDVLAFRRPAADLKRRVRTK